MNDVFEFPQNQEANIVFDKNEFWRELSSDRHATYEARSYRESKIHSYALRYVHHLMAYIIFGRKEMNSVIPNT